MAETTTPGALPPVPPDMRIDIHHMMFEMSGTMNQLVAKIDGLTKQVDKNQDLHREDMKNISDALKVDIESVKAVITTGNDKLQGRFETFQKEEFRPLRDDVANLKLKWAKVAGIAAAVGVALGFVGQLVEHLITK